MLKSPHAVKLVGTLFVVFSFFVVYSTFSGNPLFTNSGQQAQLVTGVTDSLPSFETLSGPGITSSSPGINHSKEITGRFANSSLAANPPLGMGITFSSTTQTLTRVIPPPSSAQGTLSSRVATSITPTANITTVNNCYMYMPNYNNDRALSLNSLWGSIPTTPATTFTIPVTGGAGQTKNISLVHQNPPTILQDMYFIHRDPYSYCRLFLLTPYSVSGTFYFGEPTAGSFVTTGGIVLGLEQRIPGGYWNDLMYNGAFFSFLNIFKVNVFKDIAVNLVQRMEREDAVIRDVDLKQAVVNRQANHPMLTSTYNNPYGYYYVDSSAPATNCQQISGTGSQKIVFMRSVNGNSSVAKFLGQAVDFRDYMLTKKPYSDNPSSYSFYLDLKKQASRPSDITSGAKVSSCGAGAVEYRYMPEKCDSVINTYAFQRMKSVYDKLPQTVTGKILIPWYLSSITALNAGTIKEAITAAGLDGKSLKNGLDVALLQMGALDEQLVKKIAKFITESIENLGKEYKLSQEETELLFSGMLTGDAPFTVESFSFDAGSLFKAGFGSKVVYKVKKDTSRTWSDCGNMITEMTKIPSVDVMPPPSVGSVAPVTSSPANTFKASGSGFGKNGGNTIKLTPVSPTSLVPSSVFLASAYSAFNAITNFLENLFLILKAEAQTVIGGGFYAIDTVSGDQSSVTFTVPTTVPDGTYKVSVSRFSSQFTDTIYTITVTGNGLGDPSAMIVDWSSVPIPATVPTVTLTATPSSISASGSTTISWTAANATYCSAGGGWTGSRATLGTLSVTPTTTSTYTIVCANPLGDSQLVSVTVVVVPSQLPPVLTSLNHPTSITNSWVIAQGSGFSTSTTSNTDKVEFSNGTQTVEAITGISASPTGDFYVEPSLPNLTFGNYSAFRVPTTLTPGLYTVRIARQNGAWSDPLNLTVLPAQNSDGSYNFARAIASQKPPDVVISVSVPSVLPIQGSLTAGALHTITGANFTPTGNKVQFTTPNLQMTRPVSGVTSFFDAIKSNVASFISAVTPATVTESLLTYVIENIPSANGTSITFTIPAGIPTATYTLKLANQTSEWSAGVSIMIYSREVTDDETEPVVTPVTPPTESRASLIARLLALIAELTAQLDALKAGKTEIPKIPTPVVTPTPFPTILPTQTFPVVCTQEVNQCPGGSFVSRIPPSCAFQACPAFTPPPPTQSCPTDTQTCSNGSVVSRTPPLCNFAACPNPVTPPPPVVTTTITIPPVTTVPPVTTITPTPTPAEPSVTASLSSTYDNKAGQWSTFAPGTNSGVQVNDFVWNATLTLSGSKTIRSININHNTGGEYWSTDNTNAYPLVIYHNGSQVNTSYGQTLGTYGAGANNLVIYGQFETPAFSGGTMTITFTDNSTPTTATIPASSFSPCTTCGQTSAVWNAVGDLASEWWRTVVSTFVR